MTDTLQLQAKKLNFFQRREMQKAYDQNLNGEFIAVIAWGHSDIGTGGIRSARQMRAIRKLLCSHRLRFSAISIFSLSDEIVQLYAYECVLLGKRAAGKVLKRICPALVRAYLC